MKNTVMLIIFILSFMNATNAQWYYRSCGITDLNNFTPEEFECLWSKSNDYVGLGVLLMIGGTITLFAGLSQFYEPEDIGGLVDNAIVGGSLAVLGVAIDLMGIIICWTGIDWKSFLRQTPYYENLNLGSLNVSPTIKINQFNNTPHFGMSLSLNF